jgi:hypothetical protein
VDWEFMARDREIYWRVERAPVRSGPTTNGQTA